MTGTAAEGSQAGTIVIDPASVAQPGAAEPAPQPATPAADESPEERELREAEAAQAAAANQPAGSPAQPAAPAVAAPGAEPAAGAQPAQAQPGTEKPQTVPVAALVAERARANKATQEAAYWKGRADAATLTAQPGAQPGAQQPQQPQLTLEQQLEDIRKRRLELADKYDNGDIKTRAWEEQRQALEDEEWKLRQSQLQPATAAPAHQADLTLEERTRSIEQNYPILHQLTEDDLQPLVAIAYRNAAKEGKPIGQGPSETLRLRESVAKLAVTTYGNGSQPAAAPSAPSPQTPATPGAGAPAAGPDKAALAQGHPPDVTQLGSAAPAGGVSEDQANAALARMTDDEQIAYLAANPGLVQRAVGRATR